MDEDGLADCQDPDDDGDALPDKEDPCPTVPGEHCAVECLCPHDWILCELNCLLYFLKFHSLVNPQEELVFEEFKIVNSDFYIEPPAGMTPQDVAMQVLDLASGGGASPGRGGGPIKDAIVMEIWERGERGPRLRATVGEFDPAQVKILDLNAPELAYAHVNLGTLHGPVLNLGSSWVLGAFPGIPLPDWDGDGIPNAFDNCPMKANPSQLDANHDGIGDHCQIIAITGGHQMAGDGNQDGSLDISDGVWLLGYLFLGTVAKLPCGDGTPEQLGNVFLLDSNGDSAIDLSDAVALLAHLFLGGPPHVMGKDCKPLPDCPEVPACAN